MAHKTELSIVGLHSACAVERLQKYVGRVVGRSGSRCHKLIVDQYKQAYTSSVECAVLVGHLSTTHGACADRDCASNHDTATQQITARCRHLDLTVTTRPPRKLFHSLLTSLSGKVMRSVVSVSFHSIF